MAENIFFRPPPEPAHVSIVRQYEELIAILTYIREKAQTAIDQGFDLVSSQIGFVVAVSLPVTVELKENGEFEQLVMRGEHLKGTLFEKELLPPLKTLLEGTITMTTGAAVGKGAFDIYLLWFDALKLKFGIGPIRPWQEPAHPIAAELARIRPPGSRPIQEPAHPFLGSFRPPPEPAHWFDSRIQITQEEQVLIVALDEVYPELRLAERISASRHGVSVALNPQPLPPGRVLSQELEGFAEWPQPQPWRVFVKFLIAEIEREGPQPDPWKLKMLEVLIEVISRGQYPASWKAKLLEEMIEIRRRYSQDSTP
jgi:hypothetical protein